MLVPPFALGTRRRGTAFVVAGGALLGSVLAGACASAPRAAEPAVATRTAPHAAATPADVRAIVGVLAADSLEGRGTGQRGSMVAARYIGAWFAALGLEAAGDSGYFQRVPMARADSGAPHGGAAVRLLDSFAARDSLPADRRLTGGNVVAVLRGADPALQGEAILVDAHYDHLGVGAPVAGDSIYNGADDDASGTAAVMLVARALAAGPPPKRSVVFLAATGEEVGLVGTRWYIRHPAWPLARTAGNLEIEMIGRPDPLAGGPGRAWLTGYERSTLGDALRAAGVPLVADPRPAQHFFERSDNIAYAWLGIPAHTLSSFNLHGDYHQPSDEAGRIDYDHMAAVVNATVRAVRLMADGPRPAWKPGQQPQAPAGMRATLGLDP